MMEADRDQAWVRICEEIEKAVNPSNAPVPEDALRYAASHSAPPIVTPPVGQKPQLLAEQAAPARRDVLPVIGGILAATIVASIILFLWNFNKPPVTGAIPPTPIDHSQSSQSEFTVPRLFAAGKPQQEFLLQNLSKLSSAGLIVAIPRILDDPGHDQEVAMRVAQKVKDALGVELPAVALGNDDRATPGYFEIWIAKIP